MARSRERPSLERRQPLFERVDALLGSDDAVDLDQHRCLRREERVFADSGRGTNISALPESGKRNEPSSVRSSLSASLSRVSIARLPSRTPRSRASSVTANDA